MADTNTKDVYDEIRAERTYQNDKWGVETDDTKNTPWMWASYIAQYATRWMNGSFMPLGVSNVNDFRAAMVKVAAIAVAAVESVDRQRAGGSKTTFYERPFSGYTSEADYLADHPREGDTVREDVVAK